MSRDKEIYHSNYLMEEYQIQISLEFGTMIEDMVAWNFNSEKGNIADNPSFPLLHAYMGKNNDTQELAVLLALQKDSLRQYFLARWVMQKLWISQSGNDDQEFTQAFLQCCSHTLLEDKTIAFLRDFLTQEQQEESGCCSGSGRRFLAEIFNRLLSGRFFDQLENEEFICLFLNLWKVTKASYPEENPVNEENMAVFTGYLKNAALANEELEFADLSGLDLSHMDFSGQDLSETCLYRVNFSYSKFRESNLDAVCWSGSDLSFADFYRAFMECACLENCNCRHASFHHAHMLSSVVSSADFSYADLRNTNFMECDADRIKVKGMVIDDKTALNESDLRYVNWEDVDISGLSISDSQVSHFWEVVNYTRNTILYDAKFRKLDNREVQDVIYKELKSSAPTYLKNTKLRPEGKNIFISYASEEKNQFASAVYQAIRERYGDDDKYSVWIDDMNLTMGDQLRRTIESVIRDCRAAVIIYSDHYARKGWTRYELFRILQEQKERGLNVVILKVSGSTDSLDTFQEICSRVPAENQYDTITQDDAIGQIAMRMENLV